MTLSTQLIILETKDAPKDFAELPNITIAKKLSIEKKPQFFKFSISRKNIVEMRIMFVINKYFLISNIYSSS